MSLFADTEIIRTLGFYQPFGTLMIYDKIESRWVRKGKKPPFPLGKYLFYTTQKSCDEKTLNEWCGEDIVKLIQQTLQHEPEENLHLKQYAIAIGELTEITPLLPSEEKQAFVKYVGEKTFVIKGKNVTKIQYALHFKNVHRIEPFEFKYGKQGVGILPDSEKAKIKVIQPDLIKLERAVDVALENTTKEELEQYFSDQDIPKGWVSIEDHLPQCLAIDFISKGYSEYKVKDKTGNESVTQVADHFVWYHIAKQQGITHWFNE